MHSLPPSCTTSREAFLSVLRSNKVIFLGVGATGDNSPGARCPHGARIHSLLASDRLRKLQIAGDHCLVPCSSYSSKL